MNDRNLSYAEAIREAFDQALGSDPSVFLIGEGVPDPKAIFGTTAGLREKYGDKRVMDMPLSENGMTGVCIGAALSGLRPVLIHQRLDFALLSLDQIINHAAKWRYMFNGKASIPLVIRMIVGRGWGQGPQHSQALHALFAHIPGLKVVMPTTPAEAKSLMLSAIADPDPVIYIEHRWLHGIRDHVPEEMTSQPLQGVRVARAGSDLTLVAASYMLIEALEAARALSEIGIDIEVIDVRMARPLDYAGIAESIRRTGHLLVADIGHLEYGLGAEVITCAVENAWADLKSPPRRLGLPSHPCPTSPALTENYYPDAATIAAQVLDMLNRGSDSNASVLSRLKRDELPHDAPYQGFKGPF